MPLPVTLRETLRWAPSYHDRKLAILYNNVKTTEHYLIVGKLLCDADRGKDWKHDGSGALNFYHWVDNELGLKRTQVQRMMAIWKAFSELLAEHSEIILQIDFTKLALIAPQIPRLPEEEQLGLIHAAKDLPSRALECTVAELRGKVAQDVCEHNGDIEMWNKCKQCGKFFKEG
jgi:hypothetical protein